MVAQVAQETARQVGTDEKDTSKHDSSEAELLVLKLENEQLRKQLETAELIINVQKNSLGCLA